MNSIKDYKITCVKIKIKPHTLQKVYEWQAYLNNNKEEVIQSLIQEGVFLETVFLDKIGDDYYLIYFMKVKDEVQARSAFLNSNLNVDKYHAQFKSEVFGEKIELEKLIEFINESII